MGCLWGPSIPRPQHSAGEQGGISDSPPGFLNSRPQSLCVRGGGRGRGLRSAASCLQGRSGPSRAGRRCGVGVGGELGALLPGALLSPVTLLLRALSFVAYNQVLSHRNCDRQGLTGRLLVLLCSHPTVTEMLR